MDLQNAIEKLRHREPDIESRHRVREYAVLVPLVRRENGLHLLFELRSEKVKRQPNVVCFPGGAPEEGDEDFRQTAIRECCEELGIPATDIEIVAPLDLFISPFSFFVHTFLGYIHNMENPDDLDPSRDEVAEVFEVPLDFFMETEPVWSEVKIVHTLSRDFPGHLVQEGYRWERGHYRVPFFIYGERTIWGLTARLIVNLVRLLKETDQQ